MSVESKLPGEPSLEDDIAWLIELAAEDHVRADYWAVRDAPPARAAFIDRALRFERIVQRLQSGAEDSARLATIQRIAEQAGIFTIQHAEGLYRIAEPDGGLLEYESVRGAIDAAREKVDP